MAGELHNPVPDHRERLDDERESELAGVARADREREQGDVPPDPRDELRSEITTALNCACAENESNTPDFLLAEYLLGCLRVFDAAVRARDAWHSTEPAMPGTAPSQAVSDDLPRVAVSNEEMVTVRDAMRGLHRMVEQLRDGEREQFVLMHHGQMVARVVPIERTGEAA